MKDLAFQRTWARKRREKPNKLREDPIIGFRSRLSPEARIFMNGLKGIGARSEFINQAIETKVYLLKNKKGFLLNLIQENFELAKYLVRRIGRSKT
jgi:hypothetical protein